MNSRAAIVRRARKCTTKRGTTPNSVAVDFSTVGDVNGVVDVLNGFAQQEGAEK